MCAPASGCPSSVTRPETGTAPPPDEQPTTSEIATDIGPSNTTNERFINEEGLVGLEVFAVADRGQGDEDIHVDIGSDRPHRSIAEHKLNDARMKAAPAVFELGLVRGDPEAGVVVGEQRRRYPVRS